MPRHSASQQRRVEAAVGRSIDQGAGKQYRCKRGVSCQNHRDSVCVGCSRRKKNEYRLSSHRQDRTRAFSGKERQWGCADTRHGQSGSAGLPGPLRKKKKKKSSTRNLSYWHENNTKQVCVPPDYETYQAVFSSMLSCVHGSQGARHEHHGTRLMREKITPEDTPEQTNQPLILPTHSAPRKVRTPLLSVLDLPLVCPRLTSAGRAECPPTSLRKTPRARVPTAPQSRRPARGTRRTQGRPAAKKKRSTTNTPFEAPGYLPTATSPRQHLDGCCPRDGVPVCCLLF